jgi:AraC-like DNA-binding protein
MASAIVGTVSEAVAVTPLNHRIVIGKDLRVVTQTGSSAVYGALAIPAGITHALHARPDEPLASVFLDAQYYRFEDAQRFAEAWRKFVPAQDAAIDLFDDIGEVFPRRRMDRRLERAFDCLSVGTGVAETARQVSLSESRLTHLFSEKVGISPRQWRRWLLLRKAMFALFTGQSATSAAYFAGFADAAHLSRTCRALTGATPRQLGQLEATFVTPRGRVVDCAKLRGLNQGSVTGAVTQALLAAGAVGLPQVLSARTQDATGPGSVPLIRG